MTRYYLITPKAIEEGYTPETFSIVAHGETDIYVSIYATDAEGYLWKGMNQGAAHIRGISVTSHDYATIQWFVRTWEKLGYLKEVIPANL